MNDELWRVQFGTGEIRTMTLDSLDEAFQAGLIDIRVPVLAPSSSTWTTLGEAAGLDDDVVEQAPSLSPIAMPGPDSDTSLASLPNVDADFDLDLAEVARRPRGLLIGVIPGLLAVAGALVVVVAKLGSEAPADVKVTNAAAPPAPAEVLPAPAATTTVMPVTTGAEPAAPAATPAAPTSVASPAAPTRAVLSDWQKQLLAEGDKAREEKARAKLQERAQDKPAPKPKPSTKSTPGLLNGGDRFDPLNGAL